MGEEEQQGLLFMLSHVDGGRNSLLLRADIPNIRRCQDKSLDVEGRTGDVF